jgi:nucleoside-diphosphate-sugar epimerase
MSKILITGGAGFIGYHLAEKLSSNTENQITIVDNLERGHLDADLKKLLSRPNVTLVNADLTDSSEYEKLDSNYDRVYHLAAVNGTKNFYANPYHTLRTNVLSLVHLLDWLARLEVAPRLCFTSSNEAYAGALAAFNNLPLPTPEAVPLVISEPYNPRWSYAASKIIGELLVIHKAQQHGINAVIVRPHNFYGPRAGFDHVIPELCLRIINRVDPFPLYGADQTRSFCYIDDAVGALEAVLEHPATLSVPPPTLHIGDTVEVSARDLAERLFKVAKWRPISIEEHPAPVGSVLRRVPDVSAIHTAVGWKPTTSLEHGLTATYDWYERYHKNK